MIPSISKGKGLPHNAVKSGAGKDGLQEGRKKEPIEKRKNRLNSIMHHKRFSADSWGAPTRMCKVYIRIYEASINHSYSTTWLLSKLCSNTSKYKANPGRHEITQPNEHKNEGQAERVYTYREGSTEKHQWATDMCKCKVG